MGKTASVSFLNRTDGRQHTAWDLTLFFTVQGRAQVDLSEQQILLEREDLLLVNPGETYRLDIRSGVVAVVLFHHEEVYALLQGKVPAVRCCSAGVRDGSFSDLRFQVHALLGSLLEESLGGVAFESRSCALLLTLLSRFSQERDPLDRKQQVAQWMESCSRQPITLEDAAKQFHLTPPSFSRWFPTAFECTFLKYLSRIRCRKAEAALLESDASILRIAMDQGFPNAASFSSAFSQLYGETPISYRKHHSRPSQEGVLSAREVEPFLERTRAAEQQRLQTLRIDCKGPRSTLEPYWNRLCCLGSLTQLADREVQEQVQELQAAFRFRYARLSLNRSRREGFFPEDRALGFLKEMELKPVFVVDFLRWGGDAGYFDWLRQFFRHICHRFGLQQLHVELLWDCAIPTHAPDYRDCAAALRRLFRSLRIDCILMGPGVHIDSDGGNLAACLRARPDLDRITIRCAPVGLDRHSEIQERPVPEEDYLLHQYALAREVAAQTGTDRELIITGWQTSLGSFNILNDSAWTAARILRTAFTGYGILPSLPLECPLDLLDEKAAESPILHARQGLMTLNRLRKPSFYALRFLKHLDRDYLYSDDHMLLTASQDGYFQIALQNSASLSWLYYLRQEPITAQPTPIPDALFASKSPWQARLRLLGVEDGEWLMKTRIVNDTAGSVFQAWMQLNYHDDAFMGRDEDALLRARSLPDMRGYTLSSRGGVLEVPITLGPNEIRHIHLIPKRQ